VVEFFAALGDAWRLTETQRARLTPRVQAALDMGWAPQALAAPSFSGGTGHVIGHWRTDLPAAGEAGVLPYIYVTSLDDTLRTAAEHGAELLTPPYPEGNLWVATIRDPTGNVIGVWQAGPR
jgi:predicted enzyme related to lactoylglutathione lyase